MGVFEELNKQYEDTMKCAAVLRSYNDRITVTMNQLNQPAVEKAALLTNILRELDGTLDCSVFPVLQDTIGLSIQYMSCVEAINTYKTSLLKSLAGDSSIVLSASDDVCTAQKEFEILKEQFLQKYQYKVDSADALNTIISSSVKKALNHIENIADQLREKARVIAETEYTTELKLSDPIALGEQLPKDFLVARIRTNNESLSILQDIGITSTYQSIKTDLRYGGNVMICSDFEHLEDRSIDEFIIAYVLRFIENYPLGCVNVHIFDQNTNYLYKRLNNSFQTENAGEIAKRIIQIHTSLSDLASFRDVICEDIFRKTSVEKPDLYAVYESDCSDPFNLIVLRDGLVDGSGYASSEALETINSLTKTGGIGHKCGLRFLIIDNSISFEKNLTSNNKHLVKSIQQNNELIFHYNEDASFTLDERSIEVLHIAGNLDAYVQERSGAIADAVNSKERNIVSLEDVSAAETVNHLGNIMYIPVGKAGGNVMELPLSCKDEDGTVAGQCIGYIAIGQSGSGKSSFFHSLVLNGCMKYSPRDLQFWLLDFKNGGASSKYSDCGIPHIKIIAENNKIDDALCLFQMILEEMERRSKAFNRNFTDNIIEYNKKAVQEKLEYFPRIIIAIDEVQEIFREDNASVLQKLISSISSRMRSAGMHFVMVAQNLSEGKTYMLKDAFMPSATGRICFRVGQDIPRDSGFGEDFVQRRMEISELKTGEAYVSYGKNTIKKVKMAFISPQEMNEKVFSEIRDSYSEYAYLKPRVIGSKARLSILSARQGVSGNYQDVFNELKMQKGIYDAVVGEDVYRMSPFYIHFSQYDNSSVFLLGSDKQIASSLCTSIALSLMKQNVRVHLFNADRTRISNEYESVPHPFMYFCQNVNEACKQIQNHRLDQLKDVLREIYAEYLNRQALVQQADDEDPVFDPVILIINDLFGIESFVNNEIVENMISDSDSSLSELEGFAGLKNNYGLFNDIPLSQGHRNGQFQEGTQNIISTLAKNGYRYNLHVVLSIKGDPANWRTGHSVLSLNHIILFNDTEYANQFENSYYLKEMLKNISNDVEEETVAVSAERKGLSKVRPIIYKLSNQKEKAVLDMFLKD